MKISTAILIDIGIAIIIVALEIWYDKSRWKKQLNDKPGSTLIRAGIYLVVAIFLPGKYHWDVALIAVTFFLLFDFSMNVSNWGKRLNPYYRPLDDICKNIYKTTWADLKGPGRSIARKQYKDNLNKGQFVYYSIRQFSTRFFYHGENKKKWSYDWFYNRIHPVMELMIKGCLFWIVLHFYE